MHAVVGPNDSGKTTFVTEFLALELPGYQVVLHVMLVPEELTVRRVAYRVRAGGHDVPEHKVRERYHRLWPLVVEAVSLADGA